MNIVERWLPWVKRLTSRDSKDVTLLVIHATEEPEMSDAREIAETSEELIGAHYYIDRDGSVEQWIPIERIANHTRGHNKRSIGIELINLGRYPDHFSSNSQIPSEPFPESQVSALEKLFSLLHAECPNLSEVQPHSRLDTREVHATDAARIKVRRRIDPGPMFPWERVERAFLQCRECA